MSTIIKDKIDSLIELAKLEGDTNSQIILLILRGSQEMRADGILAKHIQEFAKNVLKPLAEAGLEAQKASQN